MQLQRRRRGPFLGPRGWRGLELAVSEAIVQKSLDLKLACIHADPRGAKDFILADAKDADMALSIGAPGKSPESHPGEVRFRTLSEFRDVIVQIVEQAMVDIMLM